MDPDSDPDEASTRVRLLALKRSSLIVFASEPLTVHVGAADTLAESEPHLKSSIGSRKSSVYD
jgi:hypothetical protein